MSDELREAVRSNAAYLREVRPIDPGEIGQYIDGSPHPAVVRRTLRDLAPELGLVERADGTFAPPPAEPIDPTGAVVERFPEQYARVVEDQLVDRFGPDWHVGDTGDRLRETIRSIKAAYYADESVSYDRDAVLGYAIYHLPDFYATACYVEDDLARDGLLPRRLRVLDVGAGVGGPALGIADSIPDDAVLLYDAVEPSDPAADLLESLLAETGPNVHWQIHRTTAEAFADGRDYDPESVTAVDPERSDDDRTGRSEPTDEAAGLPCERYDLVLFANVLNELADPETTGARYVDALAPGGSLVGIAPADRETSVGLRRVERSLADAGPTADAVTVHSPTVRLWPGAHPTDDCWAFDVKPDLDPPPFQRRLDTGSGAIVNCDVQYSHFVVRRDGRRRVTVDPDPSRWARMADADGNVGDRIDLLGAKLSHSLAERDADGNEANPLFKISDGSESAGHFAVLVEPTELNRDLREAPYGAVLGFQRTLCLWNADEGAYNLVVDGETAVDRVA